MIDSAGSDSWQLLAVGDFELSSPNGDVLHVSNKKARALIMVLADARNMRRSRQFLRSMLWPNVEDDQAANSLRQCLSQLRRLLPENLLVADNESVSLTNIELQVIDEGRRTHSTFFEDAPYIGEDFEDWLRETRAFWLEKSENPPVQAEAPIPVAIPAPLQAEQPAPAPVAPVVDPLLDQQALAAIQATASPAPRRFAIGVLDNEFSAAPGDAPSPFARLADRTTEGILQTLTVLVPVDVFDLRGQAIGFGVAPEGAPDIAIRTVVEHIADQLSLTFTVTRIPSGQRLWGQTIVAVQDDMMRMDSLTLSGFIAETADRLAHKLSEEFFDTDLAEKDRLGLQAFHLLNRLFQLDPNDFPAIERAVKQAQSQNANRLDTLALSAYATTFLKGEHTTLESELSSSTSALIRAASDLSPDVRALSLTCLSHALAYVLEDHATAEDLLLQAARLTPHQAFVWDHMALLRHYQGHSEEAYTLARRAVALGAHSPFRFAYQTTLSMTATMTGRFDEALTYSRMALNARPNFLAPHRYRFIAQSGSGRTDEAAQTLANLKRLDPGIAEADGRRGRFALTTDKMSEIVEPNFENLLPMAADIAPILEEE